MSEPAWVEHMIWWRVYPLGFTGVHPWGWGKPAEPEKHKILHLVEWLDHAAQLGCNGLALNPIFTSRGHGYDTLDHYHIDPRLGVDEDFDTLVAAAHERGMKVQLDGVFNHLARGHELVHKAIGDGDGRVIDAEAAQWFRTTTDAEGTVWVNYFEGHSDLVELNLESDLVVEYIIDVMRHWLDRGADAWRLDAAYRMSPAFWAKVLPAVRETHPDVCIEGEVIHGDYPRFVAESTVDTVTQYQLWKAIWSSIDNANWWELDWALTAHNEFLDTFIPATFLGNHDTTRIASQIRDQRHLPHALALLATLPGTPTVYSGDEFGLRALKEDRLGGDDAVRPQFPATPDLLWDERGNAALTQGMFADANAQTLALHQRLLGLRRRHPWLHSARTAKVTLTNSQCVIALTGTAGGSGEPGEAKKPEQAGRLGEVGEAADRLTLALNLDDKNLFVSGEHALTQTIDADDVTRTWARSANGGQSIAPHGWAILG
ncbi:MAG: alpha-amylase [Cellulomonadaceae bacterium]|nr:alpha-amylase [Cellulomonadaceae bacterium]